MTSETQPNEESDGERWLKILGLSDLVGQPVTYSLKGETRTLDHAEDFPALCDEHVRPLMTVIEGMEPTHKDYDRFCTGVRSMLEDHLNIQVVTPAP